MDLRSMRSGQKAPIGRGRRRYGGRSKPRTPHRLAACGCNAVGSRPAGGGLIRLRFNIADRVRRASKKCRSRFTWHEIFAQFERAQAKFLSGTGLCPGFDERKCRVRELLPDSKVFRGHCEPAECEHVSARFGHSARLLPCDFIDHQSFLPSEANFRSAPAGQALQSLYQPGWIFHAFVIRRRRVARRTSPTPASDCAIPWPAHHQGNSWIKIH